MVLDLELHNLIQSTFNSIQYMEGIVQSWNTAQQTWRNSVIDISDLNQFIELLWEYLTIT